VDNDEGAECFRRMKNAISIRTALLAKVLNKL